jgi:hypothetical protein
MKQSLDRPRPFIYGWSGTGSFVGRLVVMELITQGSGNRPTRMRRQRLQGSLDGDIPMIGEVAFLICQWRQPYEWSGTMRSSRTLVFSAAAAVVAAMLVLPAPVASAQPSTQILVPSAGASVYSTKVVLDAGASSGTTSVQFELTGNGFTDHVVATATPTYYGWIALWNSVFDPVPDGTYTLQSVATEGGSSTTSPGVSITVSNDNKVSIVLPSNGATLTGSKWLDALSFAGATQVYFEVTMQVVHDCPAGYPGYCQLGYATPTYYGWLLDWNTTTVGDGAYLLDAVAVYPNGGANYTMIQIDVGN